MHRSGQPGCRICEHPSLVTRQLIGVFQGKSGLPWLMPKPHMRWGSVQTARENENRPFLLFPQPPPPHTFNCGCIIFGTGGDKTVHDAHRPRRTIGCRWQLNESRLGGAAIAQMLEAASPSKTGSLDHSRTRRSEG
jgi:hypothetical protein